MLAYRTGVDQHKVGIFGGVRGGISAFGGKPEKRLGVRFILLAAVGFGVHKRRFAERGKMCAYLICGTALIFFLVVGNEYFAQNSEPALMKFSSYHLR